MNWLNKLIKHTTEILNEKVPLVTNSKRFEELLNLDPRHALELQELEVQEWPEFTIDSMSAEQIKCIGYSNRSCLYSVLLKNGKVRYVSYDSVIIK